MSARPQWDTEAELRALTTTRSVSRGEWLDQAMYALAMVMRCRLRGDRRMALCWLTWAAAFRRNMARTPKEVRP